MLSGEKTCHMSKKVRIIRLCNKTDALINTAFKHYNLQKPILSILTE